MKYTRTALGLLTRQYRSVLRKCWLINVGLFALGAAGVMVPNEAEAGVLCYDSENGTVKYSTGTDCPDGTTTWLISLDGIDSTAIGDYSVALGANAEASGSYSVALGDTAGATAQYSTALGSETVATGKYSTALGTAANATGEYSMALGTAANAHGRGSSVFGYGNTAGLDSDDTIDSTTGATTESKDRYATAVGSYATASGKYALAIGNQKEDAATKTTASGDNSIAIGTGALAKTDHSIAIGTNTVSGLYDNSDPENPINNMYTTAVGYSNAAKGYQSSVFGYSNTAEGEESSVFGYSNTAEGYQSSAVGYSNTAEGYYSSAFGHSNKANGIYSSAFGYSNTAEGAESSAIGSRNTANGGYSLAVGRVNETNGDSSLAIGTGNTANGSRSLVIGFQGNARGDFSSAVGYASNAYGFGSSAFGSWAIAGQIADDTIDPDTGAVTESKDRYATAIGSNVSASGKYALALGNQNTSTNKTTASGESSIAIGTGAVASSKNAVVIGTNSTDGGEDTISIGSTAKQRKIVNLKAGTADTDAVNVKQLTDSLADKADASSLNNYYTKSQVDSREAAGEPIEEGSSVLSAGLVHQDGVETITGNKTFSGTNAFNGATTFGAAGSVAFNNGATVATGKSISFADGGAINKVLSAKVTENGDTYVVSATALRATLADYLTSNSDVAWSQITNTPTTLSGYGITDAVANTRKINNKELNADITLTAADVGALADTTVIGDKSLKITANRTETSFSANQSDADVTLNLDDIYNKKITSSAKLSADLVEDGSTNKVVTQAEKDAWSGKQDAITSTNPLSADLVSGLANVAKTGSYNDLSDKPTLATVATTGSYNDLSDKPTIPTVTDTYSSTSSNAMSGKAVASALADYVPTTRTINGKALTGNITLSASDVGALPSNTVIGNATLTIKRNGTAVDTFTANATVDKEINIVDNDTTYTNGNGLSLTDTTFSAKAGDTTITVDGDGIKVGTIAASKVTGLADVATGGNLAASKVTGLAGVATGGNLDASKVTGLTANRALVSSGSGVVSASETTATELGYLHGVTSGVQGQIDTINNNMFNKSNIKTAKNTTNVDNTVYSTGYINTEFNYGNVETTEGTGYKNYSRVAGITDSIVSTSGVNAFISNKDDATKSGKERGEAIAKLWTDNGNGTYKNSAITSVGSYTKSVNGWAALNTTVGGVTLDIKAASLALNNDGLTDATMKKVILDEIRKGSNWTQSGDTWTNTYLNGTYTETEKGNVNVALQKYDQINLTMDKVTKALNQNAITEAEKTLLDSYIKGFTLASSGITSIGAANDAVYENFLNNGSKLYTINPNNTIADNIVHLDAVIGKIESGVGRNVKPTQTIGENLKALDDALGPKLDKEQGYLAGIGTATGAIDKLNELIGQTSSFDFSQKSIAQTLADMPSVDQSNLVHTSGNEKIGGFKSFSDTVRANGGIAVYNVTRQEVVGANWGSKGYTSPETIHVKIPQDGGGYIEDDRYMEFTFNNGYAAGANKSAQETAAAAEIKGAWQGSDSAGWTNKYISNLHYGDYAPKISATEKAYINALLDASTPITDSFTYTNKYEDVLDDPKFTVNSQSGDTHIYGNLQADGVTKLSPTKGLTFDGTTIVKSISTAITGDGSADSLATTGAVASYVGKGKLSFTVNGAAVSGEFGANDANNKVINLGTDFIKNSHVTPTAAIKEHNDDGKVLINADNGVGVNLTNLAKYSNRILAGTKEFSAIKLGEADPITAWATSISAATTGENLPVHTKLATEKAVADYVGSTNNLTTTNKNDIVSAINEVKSTVTGDYYTKNDINSTTAGAGLVHRSGIETIGGAKTFTDAMALGSSLNVTGDTTLGGTLGVTGKTTLSAANGLSFGEQTTVAKSIVTSIGGASENALVTESAVKNYVGDGSLTLTINGNTKTAFKANQSGDLAIDLGEYVTKAQDNTHKGEVLFVNNSGNVDFSKVTNDMLSGDITAAKLATAVQTSLGKAETALQKENIDGTSILYDNSQRRLMVGKITNDNIDDDAISISKLKSLGASNALVITDTTGKLTTSSVMTSDLDNLHGLTENLAAKLDKVGGTMTGNITFATSTTGDVAVPTGIVFGNKPAVTDVSIETMNTTPSTSTLVTEQAVANYVGNATIRMQINGSPVEKSFTTNQSGDVIVDLGSYVTETQAASAKGKVLTVNSETAKVEATTVTNGMLAGEISKDKLVKGIRDSLDLADKALQTVDIKEGATDGTISVRNVDIKVHGLGSAAYADEGAFATANHGHFSSAISKMDGYTTLGEGVTGAISTSDTLNQAVAKLENGLGGKQDKLTAADDSIVISGNTIKAVGVNYSAAVDGGLSLDSTTHEFSIANEGVTNAMLQGGIAQSKIANLTTDLANKLDTSVFNARTINTKSLSEDVVLGAGDIRMTDYQKAASATSIVQNDTINQAIGKLEKALEGQQTLTAGENITIENGQISAIDTKYIAATGGGLSLAEGTNAFSIATGGITNEHINGNAGIETSKLALNTGTANTTIYYDADGHFVNGKLTGAQIADNTIADTNFTQAVRTALGKAGSALQKADITTGGNNGTISVGGTDVKVYGLGTAAFSDASAYALASHTHTSQDVTELKNYVKSATGDIVATDSLNTALSKLETGLSGKQKTLIAGEGISIDQTTGTITATGSGGGAYYYADPNGGLSLSEDHKFSIKPNGVTNDMLQGGITKAKLEDSVQQSLNLANSALQESSVSSGDVVGAIKVGDKSVEIYGLAAVAKGGSLGADKVTQDDDHKFVTKDQITSWTGKQDAISDLATIRSGAEHGESAYNTVTANKAAWDSKLSSVSITQGSTNGTIAVSVNGAAATDVAVKGLGTAAYKADTYFAPASHNHGSANVTNLSGYSMASIYSALKEDDTLNVALGKLEKGLSDKQSKLVEGSNITITGNVISATDSDTTYTTPAEGGLIMNGTAISINTGGVTNNMLAGNIAAVKLASDVQASLGLAETALQAGDIVSGTAPGSISVKGTDVLVGGLEAVATGGNLAAAKVTTDTTHQFVTNNQISAWNNKLDSATFNNRKINGHKLNQDVTLSGKDIALTNYVVADSYSAVDAEDTVNSAIGKLEKGLIGKQDTISDLTTIRTNANRGKDAYDTLDVKESVWDAKVGSVSLAGGSANGTVALTVNGTDVTQVEVTGLGTAAYQNASYFAQASHNHVSNEINKMTGYTKATEATYAAIDTDDTLNQAIGKLEYALDTKQKTLTAGTGITIDSNGKISATGGGAAYTAAPGGGLNLNDNAFSIATGGVSDAMLAGNISQNKISGLGEALDAKLNLATFNARKINGKALSTDVVLGGGDIYMTDYTKADESVAITTGDTVNQAIGKLEKALETQQTIEAGKHIEIKDGKINATYSAGTNITIDEDTGVISATGAAAPYIAKENGGLALDTATNAFSIADKGVTFERLGDDLQAAVTAAGTALQKADITTGGTNGTIRVDGTDVAVKGLDDVALGGNLAAARVTESTSRRFVSDTEKSTWDNKIGSITAATATNKGSVALSIDGTPLEVAVKGLKSAAFSDASAFAAAQHNHKSSEVTTLDGYAISETGGALTTSDSLNVALGKLEKNIKNNKLTAGNNITIDADGKINATDTKYSAAATGGLTKDDNNAFSIDTGGVTNTMLAGEISKDKLDSEVSGLLSKAGSSIQTVKVNNSPLTVTDNAVNIAITEGNDNGAISVNGAKVAVHGLADVATGGNLSADKVTTDATNRFVADTDIAAWNAKQDAISDLATIRNNATAGKSANDTLATKASVWDAKIGEVSATSGNAPGKIALTVDGNTTQVSVAGLGSAAYKADTYFALASHSHVASAIEAMTGYEIASAYSDITETDSLNDAIGKLEKGVKSNKLTAGTGIDITDGVISATGSSGAIYHAGAGLALDDTTKTFSVSGVTNTMLAGGITADKLHEDVQAAINGALQEDDITESTANGKIKVGTKDVAINGLADVALGGNLTADKVTTDATHQFVTNTEKSGWNSKIGSIAAGTASNKGSIALTIDGSETPLEVEVKGLKSAAFSETSAFAAAQHNHKSSEVTSLEGYVLANEAEDVAATDTLNQALGKLQKSIKTNKLTAGDNIDITNGVISATDTKYGVATNGGLAIDGNNKFSIAAEGVTNAMLKGNITKAKLDSDVQTSLGKADTALQSGDITVGGTKGTISVKGADVAVNGLKTVATSGAAADLTTDTGHRLVTDTEKEIWSGKQDAIDDLTTIRSNATAGKSASDTLATKASVWDAKVGSISLTTGTTDGTVALSINGGVATDVAVAGLGTAAYKADNYFALSVHNHVSSAINAMTGYTKATETTYAPISTSDTLNQAIGKLEYGLGTKQKTLTAGAGVNITADGVISVTGGGSGAYYYAGDGLDLNGTNNTFSIANNGVTNAMLAGGISNDKLALNSGTAGKALYYDTNGTLTSGLLTYAQLDPDANIQKDQLSVAVRNALTKAENAVAVSDFTTGSTQGTISVDGTDVAVKGLGSAAFTNSTAYAASSHTHTSADVTLMTGYTKYANANPIEAGDSLNVAIGKLEKGLDGKQKTLIAGDNISIDSDGRISATGSGGGTYTAGDGLALSNTNVFSIATGGITNNMVKDGEITKAKLASTVQDSLDAADSALQSDDITEGTTNGAISVNGNAVKVHGLADVATTGAAADLQTDADHRLVTDSEKTAWNNKQDAITDLANIRSNATAGKNASDTLATKADIWDAKVDSISTATGEGSNGKIAVTANGVTTQVAVAGLKAGAFKEVDSAVTEGSDKLITSGAVKSYVAGIDGNSIHQSGNEDITGTKTFKKLQKFEKVISSGDDAGTYTTELDGDTLKLNKGLETKITLDGKDGSATYAGLLNANGGINTTTLVVNNGMTVIGASNFKDNVTIGSTASGGTRDLTVNGGITATGKTTLSADNGLSFGNGQEVTSIVNSITGSGNALKKQLVTAAAVKAADDALSDRIDDISDAVSARDEAIAQNTSDIATNKTNIAANKAAIEAQAATISQHTTDIAQNKADIATNAAAIAAQASTIAGHTSQIATNTSAISGLDSRVTTLENTTLDLTGVREAMGGKFDAVTHKWSAEVTADKGVTYGTLPATDLVEAISKVNSNIGIGTNLDATERRTEVAANNGVSSANSVNDNIRAVNDTIGDLSGLNTEFKNLTNGGSTVPTSVVTALNNLDATLGTIHGLADKRKAAGTYKGNLAEGTTVEMHLSKLDDAIGDRTTISNEKGPHGYAFSTETMYVADVLTDIASQIGTAEQLSGAPNGVSKDKTVNQNIAAVSKAVGNVADLKDTYFLSETTNLTDAVRVLDADMYKMSYAVEENRSEINRLRRKLRGGMASLSALTALAPNSRADGKTQLSIGTGMYDSSPAVAVGAYHWLTNNLMLNAGLAWGDADDAVYRMGLTYSF